MLRALFSIMSENNSDRTPFWKNVDVQGKSECWEWRGDIDILTGFGVSSRMVHGSEVVRKAHRIAYILRYGTVPSNHVVRHTCRNQLCCNPDHLIPMRKHPEEEDEHLVTAYYYSSRRAAKLSDFEKRRMGELRDQGTTIKEIARRFKVSSSTVSRTLKGNK
jgi:AraC-like DNA-binding protein